MTGDHDLRARLLRHAHEHGTGTALTDDRRSVTYRGLLDEVDRLAGQLHDLPEPTARWGVRTGNDIASVATVLALTGLGHTPVLLDPRSTAAEVESVVGLARLAGVVDPGSGVSLDTTRWSGPRPSAGCFGMVSSGTNGVPKVVRRPWAATVAAATSFASAAGYTPADTILCTTPLHHSYGFTISLVAGLLAGATVVLAPSPARPAELSGLIAATGPTVLQSVPFLYRVLLDQGSGPAPGRTRLCITAGERLDPQLAEHWRQATGTGLSNHYGATENCVVTLAEPDDTVSVGRPVAGVDIRIAGADDEFGTEGEVLVRGPGPQCSYWGQPTLSRRTFSRGWQRTGDHGRLLPDGRLVLAGRLTQRISVAGRKVDAVEVEQALRTHPAVRDAAVTGFPDHVDRAGFVAFVDAPGVTEIELRRHLAGRLSAYKVPTRLVLVPELPRTGTRKVHLARLWHELETP